MNLLRINLAVRFFLELAALFAFGRWGWTQAEGWLAAVLAAVLPAAGALIWGIFAVPGDPSRSGQAPVPVPGWMRLALELGIFALAAWALAGSGLTQAGLVFGSLVCIHYLLSGQRIKWLLRGET